MVDESFIEFDESDKLESITTEKTMANATSVSIFSIAPPLFISFSFISFSFISFSFISFSFISFFIKLIIDCISFIFLDCSGFFVGVCAKDCAGDCCARDCAGVFVGVCAKDCARDCCARDCAGSCTRD